MRKHILLAALGLGAMAAPAAAQNVTGTVDLIGNVPPKCQVVPGGATTFGGTVDFGDISDTDGTLRNLGTVDATTNADLGARVVCNTATANVSLSATPMTNGGAAPAAGYANSVDYSASVSMVETGGSTTTLTLSSTSGSPTSTTIGRLAGSNVDPNVAISATGFTTGTGTEILETGSYAGQIVVVISPI